MRLIWTCRTMAMKRAELPGSVVSGTGVVVAGLAAGRVAKMAPAALALIVLSGCGSTQPTGGSGDPARGAALIEAAGCGGCHTIPGIAGANGLVGPPLDRMGSRLCIAGLLRNTNDNMIHWLMDPQAVVPGNVMLEMGLAEADAADIAAYLSTLR